MLHRSIGADSDGSTPLTSANDLIAEAYLRCSRVRTAWSRWRSKSAHRMDLYRQLSEVADQFRVNYTKWSVLKKWQHEAKERETTQQLSMIAWQWHTRRRQRAVVAEWARVTREGKQRRRRILLELKSISEEAELRLCLQSFFMWLGFGARGNAAAAFCQVRTNRNLMKQALLKWRRKLAEKQAKQLCVQFLSARHAVFIAESSPQVAFQRWLHFWAQRRAVQLARDAASELKAEKFRRKSLLKQVFASLRNASMESKAHRICRRRSLTTTFVTWREKFERTSADRVSVKALHERTQQRMLAALFVHWHRSTVMKQCFNNIHSKTVAQRRRTVLAKWRLRVAEAKDAAEWRAAANVARRQLVLKRGFESLLQASARMGSSGVMLKNAMLMKQRRDEAEHDVGQGQRQQQQSPQEIEATIRSLLKQFQVLMLTHAADAQLLADVHCATSVRNAAMQRSQERERLRSVILQLRESLRG